MSSPTTDAALRGGFRSAWTQSTSTQQVVDDIVEQFGADVDPGVVMVFLTSDADGAKVTALLSDRWPGAEVLGCTTAGEFNDTRTGHGGASALALPARIVKRAVAEIAGFRQGTVEGIDAAVERVESRLGSCLRDLSPTTCIGLVLVDGLHGDEEAVNQRLGYHAPALSFVGGSAGDDQKFAGTRVFCNGRESDRGAALLMVEVTVPFAVLKTCSLRPGPHSFTVTRADVARRVVHEVDGRPVLEAYAEALGISPGELDEAAFIRHPWGLMIDDDPWVRSPLAVLPDGGLRFYCQIPEGMQLSVMDGGDLVGGMRSALDRVRQEVGGSVSGAVLFNCILRRLEMDADDLHPVWTELLRGTPTAGFHTYGESWLGHINQTCVGVVFGSEAG